MTDPAASTRSDHTAPAWRAAMVPPLLYGVRVAAAVSLALFVAFFLELDNPSWAGTSAAIVCQPILGASLRKGFFRLIGTVIGATMAVVLTGIFPQNRVGFLVGMALWAACCAFAGTLMRNFAAYAAMLSGYTLAIIAGDSISAPDQVFTLAVARASEISLGIVCATLIMGLSDLGRSPGKLAAALDSLGHEIRYHFTDLLENAGGLMPDGSRLRRDLIKQVAGLDPMIDQAIGEAPELRYRKAILGAAMSGLFAALSGWRIVESHLRSLPAEAAHEEAGRVTERLPATWHSATADGSDETADRLDLATVRSLVELDTDTVSQRLLADAAARVALGLSAAANGLALLHDPAAARDPARGPSVAVADTLPALVNAIRVFVSIGAAILFWILTEWPSGLTAITFMAVTVLLLSPQQEQSGPAALGFGLGTLLTACLAAIVNFALLPNHEGFLSLALILSTVLIPLAALSTVPVLAPYLVAASMNFVPLVAPSNQISFDTVAFANSALGIVGGCMAGAIALSVIPPVPIKIRADRLIGLTLRDLRRMAAGRRRLSAEAWESLVYARLVALPEDVDPAYGLRLVAALSMGLQVIRLKTLPDQPGRLGQDIDESLRALAARDRSAMMAGFDRVDRGAAALPNDRVTLRIRTAVQVIREVMPRHGADFGSMPS